MGRKGRNCFDGGANPLPLPERRDRPPTGWECYAQKPDWGLWTSTAVDESGLTSFLAGVVGSTSDLGVFASDKSPPFARYRITISPSARVFEVDGPESWHHLCVSYPAEGKDG